MNYGVWNGYLYAMKSGSVVLKWTIFIALALTWGSSFILMKRGLEVYSSEQVAALRIFIAFLFLAPLGWKYINKQLLRSWQGAVGMGVFGNLIPAFLFTKAETVITSALTGMLNSLTPLFTLVVGLFIFRTRVNWWQVFGVVLGILGTIALLQIGDKDERNTDVVLGTILVIAATLCYGISVNIIKIKLDGVNAIAATVFAMYIIGPVAGIYLFSTDFISRLSLPGAYESLSFIAILAVFGTALSVIVFNILIRESGALFASSVTYLIPIVAMGWGLLDHEIVTWMHAVCIAVILGGVWLVNKK
jgi:drug/metabolite transporter (DMT)-like permease